MSQGIVICVGGLGMLVASDELTDKDWPAMSRAKGDVFMLVGASLYGFSKAYPSSSFVSIQIYYEFYSERNRGILRPPLTAL